MAASWGVRGVRGVADGRGDEAGVPARELSVQPASAPSPATEPSSSPRRDDRDGGAHPLRPDRDTPSMTKRCAIR